MRAHVGTSARLVDRYGPPSVIFRMAPDRFGNAVLPCSGLASHPRVLGWEAHGPNPNSMQGRRRWRVAVWLK